VTIGAPADAEHVTHLFRDHLRTLETDGDAEVSIAGRSFTLRRAFLDDARATNMSASLEAMRTPLLVMHAPLDDVVGLRNAERIFKGAWHPKSFLALDGADHLLSNAKDAEYARARCPHGPRVMSQPPMNRLLTSWWRARTW
jgi:fermentation-respiration switch protein FrsA (DUF1100 family)